ncbi:hypothetical protein MCOR29_000304 [Pyricularia oryzae]|nr:hypothetical protein MCOR29_000304 [Pyricularia oryzae]KAI6340399.1 hypothetical protein MCOR30_002532 [Pyricularia oryzae]KAI6366166.1 hypothetical protein MCOR32_007517 [Pyricularia oryzae]
MSAGTTGDISAAPSAEIYDTDRFGELYYASRDIPTQNLGLAGRYLTSVFKNTRRDQGIDRDYTDLSFLIQTYTDQIRSFQGYLNLEHCDLFIQDAILEESQQMSEWYALVLKDSQVEGEDGALAAV